MIIYYSIYTGCCSVMTIDCFSLYIWVYKDIIYMKMTYCRSKTLMQKSMYWNILIYLQHHFDKNIVCHSHTKSLEKVIRVYHIFFNDIWSKITNKQIVWSLSLPLSHKINRGSLIICIMYSVTIQEICLFFFLCFLQMQCDPS